MILDWGPTTGDIAVVEDADVVVSAESRDDDSSPWPHLGTPSSRTLKGAQAPAWDIVDEWGAQSFPASDPPANW